jgi:hypothetical protein
MSTQPDPTVAAARSRRSRSRSRSHNSVATTLIDEDSNVGRTATIVEMELLQTPQIAPGRREHRYPAALDERGTRQLMRSQSLRLWWHIRGRMHNHGGVDCKVLKPWMNFGFPASPTASVDGIALASPEHNVVVDPVKEKALWDTWGRAMWRCIVAAEEDWIVDNGYTFEMSDVQFAFDSSLFKAPSSPFINVVP